MAAIGFLSLLGTAVSAVGTIAGGAAARQQSEAQAQMNEYRARQAEIEAGEARAAAQREAMQKEREGSLALSNLQAMAAASGAGAADPTIVGLGESLAGESRLGADIERYKGESRARGLEDQATLQRLAAAAALAEGEARLRQSYFSAGSSLLGGFGSAFSRYARGARGEWPRRGWSLGDGL
jgi:hypothetical protein